jgi:cytochrome c-type biogenesis protein
MPEPIRDAILEWYGFLSSLSANAMLEIGDLDARIRIPLISALLLGLIGAAAPCQLTTSLGALAVLGGMTPGRVPSGPVVAYLAGKALVYSGLGLLAVALGAGLTEVSVPVFVTARKTLGPLMVLVGLAMLGALRLRWAPGADLTARLPKVVRRPTNGAPFLLGVAFGFSFCPTLFGLFFGVLIPLALSRPDGLLYPGLFEFGTTLPLLIVLGLVSLGGGSLRAEAGRLGRGQRIVGIVAGALLVLAGLHDTAVYWFL